MSWLWFGAFLLAQAAIALWAARRVGSEEDFFVAGRKLGTPMVALSLFATWFGAETCLGASGAVYRDGLSGARADPLGYALCLLLMGLLFAARFSEGRFLTLGDLYRRRFGARTEKLAVLVILPSSLVWGAAQVRAFGQVLAATSDLEVDAAVTIAASLVVAYTFVGGLLGDVLTDMVQSVVLSLGLVLLAVLVLRDAPDVGTALGPERLAMLPPGESVWVQVDRWSVPILGSVVAQELVARVLAARSPAVARRGSLVACGLYLVVGAIPITLGLLGPALLPGLEDPEQLLPTLAAEHLPHALAMLFSCSLMAAILSTVDSILLSSSALLSHNLLVPALGIRSERGKLLLGRAVVVATGAFAYVVALHAERIYDLVETASALGTAGILVTTVGGLFGRFGGARAAAGALVCGLIMTPIAEHGLALPAPFLFTVVCCTGLYLGLGAMEKRLADTRVEPTA